MSAPLWQQIGCARTQVNVPSHDEPIIDGLSFRVRPAYSLRRWTRFPFFFEHHNPEFDLHLQRISPPPPADQARLLNGKIEIRVYFEYGANSDQTFEVPQLAVGQSTVIRLEDILTERPGQTAIRLLMKPPVPNRDLFRTLYSYRVRPEEHLWLAGFAVFFASVSLFGTALASRSAPAPQITIVVPTAAAASPSPSPSATP